MAKRRIKVEMNLLDWFKYAIQLRQLRADIARDEQDYIWQSQPPS